MFTFYSFIDETVPLLVQKGDYLINGYQDRDTGGESPSKSDDINWDGFQCVYFPRYECKSVLSIHTIVFSKMDCLMDKDYFDDCATYQ